MGTKPQEQEYQTKKLQKPQGRHRPLLRASPPRLGGKDRARHQQQSSGRGGGGLSNRAHTSFNLFGYSQFSIRSFLTVHTIPFVESFPVDVLFSFGNRDAPAATQRVPAGSADWIKPWTGCRPGRRLFADFKVFKMCVTDNKMSRPSQILNSLHFLCFRLSLDTRRWKRPLTSTSLTWLWLTPCSWLLYLSRYEVSNHLPMCNRLQTFPELDIPLIKN